METITKNPPLKLLINRKVEVAISCTNYHLDISQVNYTAMLIEAGWNYAYEWGNVDLIKSDTFWAWFQNQYKKVTVAFAAELEATPCKMMPSHAELMTKFKELHSINPDKIYPQAGIFDIIQMELANYEGGNND